MEHFLISIIPSEDITLKIRKLRTLLFKKYSIISSRCLPEMIPVAFTNEIINKDLFMDISQTKELNSSICILTEINDIYLKINNTDLIESIEKRIGNYKKSGFISLKQGFYLGSGTKDSDIGIINNDLKKVIAKSLSWKKNSLELIKIEIKDDIWWNNIQWETIWSQKIHLP